jgi:Predicted protease with the C-terminal PDZ domain
MVRKARLRAVILVLFACAASAAAQVTIRLDVDASEAFRNIVHVKEVLDVRGGDIDLFYPKWIPGEHAPDGTINDMVNFFVNANGKAVAWRRDDVEMFAFHVSVPAGVRQIEVSFDDASQPGTVDTAALARIKWNRLLVYPRGVNSDNINVTASMRVPTGWQYATALTENRNTGDTVYFNGTNLTEFIDSPAIIGKYFAKVPLSTDPVPVEMDIAGETAESIKYSPETLAWWKNLVAQANLAFGAHHYRKYRFLLTVSDEGGDEGLEHHESSEDGVGEDALSDRLEMLDLGDLLSHEYTHSWNGKYRRPASLTTPDFEQPMKGDLLWVYEGLTQYLGHVFPARSGVWTPEMFRDVFADTYAGMNHQSGRGWRPLVDTAVAVQYTYPSPRPWMNARRRVDYYDEGSLIWLDVDVLIRQQSNGKLSLDDFLHKFHGGPSGAPAVVTYDLDEIVRTLNSVVPYDWKQFFIDRVYKVAPTAPIGGITNGGWKLIYNDTPNLQMQVDERSRTYINEMYSIGLNVDSAGTVRDINQEMAAAKAGIAPGMKIIRVNDGDFSLEGLRNAVIAAKDPAKGLTIQAQNGKETGTYKLAYSEGEKFPHLVRDGSKPDYLSAIAKPK